MSPRLTRPRPSSSPPCLFAQHGAKLGGETNLSAGLQVAGLALKHRQNKNQRQRIVVFVGSPVKEEEAALVKLGKKLKKNSVAVDIVNFGEEAENTQKLEALLNAVNSDDNSHLVTVPPGPHVLSDILLSSPIVQGEDGGGGGGGGMPTGGGGANEGFAEFGVDPTLDPEFAWALRVSMEEERQRQANEAAKAGGEGAAASSEAEGGAASSSDAPMAEAAAGASGEEGVDEAALLEAAIAMSLPDASLTTPAAAVPAVTPGAPEHGAAVAVTQPTPAVPTDVAMGEAADEDDEAMQLALAMSMSQEPAATAAQPAAGSDMTAAMFQDPSFVQSVLGSLPGVDPNDPRIQSVLNAMPQSPPDGEKKEGDDKKEGGSS